MSYLDSLKGVYQVEHSNIKQINVHSPIAQHIRIDTNMNCNLHCLYCHNARNNTLLKEEDLDVFLAKFTHVDDWQIGCAMEPTMDKRMGKIALKIAQSTAQPRRVFRIQTNATLLHKHDLNLLHHAGVNTFTISLDTIHSDIHQKLRGGSDLTTILNNIVNVRKTFPKAKLYWIATINALNLPTLDTFFKYAIHNGIDGVELRKMFYHPTSNVIQDHDTMKKIWLTDLEFHNGIERLVHQYRDTLELIINDERMIRALNKATITF